MNVYYELEIAFNDVNYETIYNTLYRYEINSILEDSGKIIVSFPENDIEIINRIKDSLVTDGIVNENNIHVSKIENMDWNKEWEKTIEPVNIKNKIIIYPSWKKNEVKNNRDKILIEIDPKMSFGTGHNETTQLILELMIDYVTPQAEKMLDFGCGTGILAIAAIKLGMKCAIAIDIDEDSIVNTKENLMNNNVQNKIILYKTEIYNLSENNFDIICANITSSVILPNLSTINYKLKYCGKLFITGILTEEINEIKEALIKNRFDIIEIRNKADWTGIYCKKI